MSVDRRETISERWEITIEGDSITLWDMNGSFEPVVFESAGVSIPLFAIVETAISLEEIQNA